MRLSLYLLLSTLLLISAFIVFRRIVRKDYLQRRRLSILSSFLELLVFGALMFFPELYNPPEWAWFWRINGSTSSGNMLIGLIIILLGFMVAFGTMLWFGVRRAFGIKVDGLINTGPYRITRNPQVLGGYLLVIGVSVQWPSWYSLGWVALYGVMSHMMILSEEEYLRKYYGELYERFCEEVPRYFIDVRKMMGSFK